ncbi:DUF3895 domain-containing protein [Sutcliffiella horikoshii]
MGATGASEDCYPTGRYKIYPQVRQMLNFYVESGNLFLKMLLR